jgi:hypothetical protein
MNDYDDDDALDAEIEQLVERRIAYLDRRFNLVIPRVRPGAWFQIQFAAHNLEVCVLGTNRMKTAVLVECPQWRAKMKTWIPAMAFAHPDMCGATFIGYGQRRWFHKLFRRGPQFTKPR